MAGRPAHKPTDAQRGQVQAMAAYGIPQNDIARVIDVSANTLRKHYADELETGATKANAKVGQFLYRAASGEALKDGASWADCTRAAMFWGKTRMGMRETQKLEHSGPGGGPISVSRVEIVAGGQDS